MLIKKTALYCLLSVITLFSYPANATNILLTGKDIRKQLAEARPGDVFTFFPGVYEIKRELKLAASGTKSKPITIRPSLSGSVTLEIKGKNGFKITGSNWIIEDLVMRGACENEGKCHHAMHIAGNADNIIIRRNVMTDFNSTIKANGAVERGVRLFPDKVTIEGNHIFNRWPRNTKAPVTLVDVVGGRNWVVRDNFIADFHKLGGNRISYAAFLKGNSENGLFERNLVICEWKHKGGTRLGLSLGGGGTGQKYCQGGNCRMEHYKGTIRGNVIMNCPKDVGIYLNKAANTQIVNNTILNTGGIDVRFGTSFATIANNVVEGRIKDRDGGRHHDINNIVGEDASGLYPRRDYGLKPTNPRVLRRADTEFPGIDFCTGTQQDTWIGAFAEPKACSLEEKLLEAETKAVDAPGDNLP